MLLKRVSKIEICHLREYPVKVALNKKCLRKRGRKNLHYSFRFTMATFCCGIILTPFAAVTPLSLIGYCNSSLAKFTKIFRYKEGRINKTFGS